MKTESEYCVKHNIFHSKVDGCPKCNHDKAVHEIMDELGIKKL